jgi:hypothetical protein
VIVTTAGLTRAATDTMTAFGSDARIEAAGDGVEIDEGDAEADDAGGADAAPMDATADGCGDGLPAAAGVAEDEDEGVGGAAAAGTSTAEVWRAAGDWLNGRTIPTVAIDATTADRIDAAMTTPSP